MTLTPWTIVSMLFSAAVLAGACAGCGNQSLDPVRTETSTALRPLSTDERQTDFDYLVRSVNELYIPRGLKEKRFHFRFADVAAEARRALASVNSDDEFQGLLQRMLARLHDGHVALSTETGAVTGWSLPISVRVVHGVVLVDANVDADAKLGPMVGRGDQLVALDGRPVFDYLPLILAYHGDSTAVRERDAISFLFDRPSYMRELVPKKAHAIAAFRRANGTRYVRTFIWSRRLELLNRASAAPSRKQAQKPVAEDDEEESPFFATAEAEATLRWKTITPSLAALERQGFVGKSNPAFARAYQYAGKSLLLIRVPISYEPDKATEKLAWYKAVLEEHGVLADAIIMDITRNPGGSAEFATNLATAFSPKPIRGDVHYLNADRGTMNDLEKDLRDPNESRPESWRTEHIKALLAVEEAYDRRKPLTDRPYGLELIDGRLPVPEFAIAKPTLVLVDHDTASSGELFAVLLKENGLATLFGETTGGLGGIVQKVGRLPSSQLNLSLTRTLFTIHRDDGRYDSAELIESNGVTPHIAHAISVRDFRAGYVEYARAFSKAAADLASGIQK